MDAEAEVLEGSRPDRISHLIHETQEPGDVVSVMIRAAVGSLVSRR